jgi:hypothetical protein
MDKEVNDHSSIAVSESFNHTLNDDILKRKKLFFLKIEFFLFTLFLHR